MRIRLAPSAVGDLAGIRDYYRDISKELEVQFLDQLDVAMERLRMFPKGAPPVEGFPGVRRARLRQFPYGMFYRLDGHDILILRVLHSRRQSPASAETDT